MKIENSSKWTEFNSIVPMQDQVNLSIQFMRN